MGNAVGSLFSGFGQLIGNVLGHPLDFLSGQSCYSICAPTWDFVCYIENFCVAHLLKFVMVAMLVYFGLLLLYLLYNLGICQCICHTLWRVIWACVATCFSSVNFCCTCLCHKLRMVKRTNRRRKRDIENLDMSSTGNCTSSNGDEYELQERSIGQQPRDNLESRKSHFSKRRNYRDEHLKRSLRAANHHIRVTRSSRFMQNGVRGRIRIHRKRV